MDALPPLTEATFWQILNEQLPDETVNALVWQELGYRRRSEGDWDLTQVPPEWQQAYPEPPDFIGSRPATVQLTRSIPAENKQLLKEQLGFAGYQVSELTPRRTRRATAVNWLLSRLRQTGRVPG